ncbi:MAG: hypothetical protein A2Z88_00505 [Omnitrophica WOR_2 bacterium GWA2_47_8]|nr:MAG: hypothetical protein A2Z88_00505 [Omnitrophica WOR_2 bacterium GWA2_47_8]
MLLKELAKLLKSRFNNNKVINFFCLYEEVNPALFFLKNSFFFPPFRNLYAKITLKAVRVALIKK